jgi:hypothetical protein
MKRRGYIGPINAACIALAALVVGCSSAPSAPDWQSNAKAALDRGVSADLAGDTRVANVEFALARRELASTGRADQVALAELTRCAVRVASLDVGPCKEFEPLRPAASPAQRAYADYLDGRLQPADIALLPQQHRAVAASTAGAATDAAVRAIDDPLSRLVAIGVLFQAGRADPPTIALAVETASAQGWRRPLLAWLGVQLALAEKQGDRAGAADVQRRIELVQDRRPPS